MNVDHYQSGEEVYGEECEKFAVVCLHFRHSIHFHPQAIDPSFVHLFTYVLFVY